MWCCKRFFFRPIQQQQESDFILFFKKPRLWLQEKEADGQRPLTLRRERSMLTQDRIGW